MRHLRTSRPASLEESLAVAGQMCCGLERVQGTASVSVRGESQVVETSSVANQLGVVALNKGSLLADRSFFTCTTILEAFY